jgi:RNA polymerase sigma-70 factor (ECF subfamily)
MRLCKLLSEHRCGQKPMTYALLSLMCFQASRFESRMDENNSIILLQQQDRNKWDRHLIGLGYHFLSHSSFGEAISIYHIESAIAAEHALAPSFEATNWKRLLGLYDLLLVQKQTPVVWLNRSVILAQSGELEQAIETVLSIPEISNLLETQYMYSAVLGDLYLQSGEHEKARHYLGTAYSLTPSQAEKKLIAGKLSTTNSKN